MSNDQTTEKVQNHELRLTIIERLLEDQKEAIHNLTNVIADTNKTMAQNTQAIIEFRNAISQQQLFNTRLNEAHKDINDIQLELETLKLVKRIVYGLVTTILVQVLAAILFLVIQSS